MPLPATSHRFRRRLARAGLFLALGLLGGCGEGDLGRIKSNYVIDDIHGWIGADAVGSIGGRPSHYALTDDERELRDLAYPLIEAPFDRQRWYSILGEYGLNGFRRAPYDITAYSRVLMGRSARSTTMRYQLFLEDVRNDIVRIGPFFRVAVRVADLDAKRAKSLQYVTGLNEAELGNALSRIAENQLATGWVQYSLHQRVEAYRFALERLVIAYPSPMAVDAEQQLNRLRSEIDAVTPAVVAVNPPPRAQVSK